MARSSHSGRFRVRLSGLLIASVAFLATASAGIAQSPPEALPANANVALDAISPTPEFPGRIKGLDLERESDLAGTAKRLWRDAGIRFGEGRWADAAEKLDGLIQSHPGFADARVLRARCHARMGDSQRAIVDLQAAIGAAPRHVAAHELAGETALLSGDKATAIYEFRLALLAAPSSPRDADRIIAVLFLARTLESEGYLRAAADLYAEFLESTSDLTLEMRRNDRLREMIETTGPELQRRIAAIRARLGETTKAANAWEQVVRENAGDANAWRELAHAQAQRNDVDDAFRSLKRYLAQSKLGANAAIELDALCGMMPNSKDIEEKADGVVRDLEDAALTIQWAKRYIASNRRAKAKRILDPAAEAHPELSEVQYLLARLEVLEGDTATAYAHLVNAVKLDSNSTSELLSHLRQDGDTLRLDALIAAASAHVAANSADVTSRLVYANLLIASRQTESAIEQLVQVTRSLPDNISASISLCEAYIDQLNWTAALETADGIIAKGARAQRLYYLKGLAHDALSEDEAAREALEIAGQIDPKKADAFLALAANFERGGDRRSAEVVYRQILGKVDPDCATAREHLIVYFMNMQRFQEAQSMFEQIERRHPDSPELVRCSAMIDLLASADRSPEIRLETYLDKLQSILRDRSDDVLTRLEIAKTFMAVDRHDEAIVELESAVRTAPDNIKILELKAEVHARLLDFAAAETVIDRLLQHRPRDIRYIGSKLDFTSDRGDSDKMIETLRTLVNREDLAEHVDRFTQQLIVELKATDRFDEAVRVTNSWLLAKPDDFLRRNLHLEALALADRHDEAIQLAREYHDKAPTDRVAQIQLLANLQAAHRITEAKQIALGWLADRPTDFDLTAAIIRLCWSSRDWDDAIDIAKSAIEDANQPRRYEQLLSLTYQFAGRNDEAIEMRRQSVRISEKLLESARADARRPRPDKPSDSRRNSIQLSTIALRQANYDLINALTNAERYTEAERLIESLLSPMLSDSGGFDLAYVIDLRNLLSEVYRATDREVMAIEQLEEIYKLTPQDDGANNNLSYTLADTGRQIERAEKLVRFALAKDPTSSPSLDTLGWVLYKQGRFEEAAFYLRRAFRAAQFSDPVVLDHLADTYYRMGRLPEAARAWNSAVKMCDPQGDPPPSRDRVRLHATIRSKLDAVEAGASVDTAPLALTTSTTMPAEEDQPAADQ